MRLPKSQRSQCSKIMCLSTKESRLCERRKRTRVQASLSAIPQLHVFSSAVNFDLIELESLMLAFTVVERLREAGIFVRDCSNVPGLNDRTI